MSSKVVQRWRRSIDRREARPTDDGLGTKTVIVAHEAWDIEITVDMGAIGMEMGEKAILSKGGVCRDGHVVVRRVKLLESKPVKGGVS